MGYGHGWMWGASFPWWIVWLLIFAVLLIALLRRRPPTRDGPPSERPLDILERRYAAGEISTEEFEERKARLSRSSK